MRPGQARSVEGTVSAHRAGYGFVRVEGMKDSVFLPPREMRGAHAWRSRAREPGHGLERALARQSVEKVLERGVNAFLGTVEIQGRSCMGERRGSTPAAALRRRACAISTARAMATGSSRASPVTPSASGPAQARIEKRLDPDRPVELATESAIARFELPHEFSAAALREAQAFGDKVDPDEAQIAHRSARPAARHHRRRRCEGLRRCGLRRAAPARLSAARRDRGRQPLRAPRHRAGCCGAVERGTSVYFPTRVVPMLPHALSDHLCSLAPHVDRLCYVADMVVTTQGALKSATFLSGHHALRRAPHLHAGQRRAVRRQGRRAAADRSALGGSGGSLIEKLMVLVDVYRALYKARGAARRAGFRRRRSASSSSIRPSACAPSSCARATMRTGSSRNA